MKCVLRKYKKAIYPSQQILLVSTLTLPYETNLALMRMLNANFEVNLDFDIPNSIPIPASKKQAFLIACRRQYFINGLATLVNRKGAVVGPKGRTLKTKNNQFFINFPVKPKKSLVIVKYIDMMVPAF